MLVNTPKTWMENGYPSLKFKFNLDTRSSWPIYSKILKSHTKFEMQVQLLAKTIGWNKNTKYPFIISYTQLQIHLANKINPKTMISSYKPFNIRTNMNKKLEKTYLYFSKYKDTNSWKFFLNFAEYSAKQETKLFYFFHFSLLPSLVYPWNSHAAKIQHHGYSNSLQQPS